jgi:Uncharacterized protein conserved in bacteria (DUF2330)
MSLLRRLVCVAAIFSLAVASLQKLPACCPIGHVGEAVVNADQSVVILWDAAKKTQHFIRRASFQSQSADFGFLIPSPTRPELAESGNEVFPFLQKLTEPEVRHVKAQAHGGGCGCGMPPPEAGLTADAKVEVLEQKLVAGFHAAVLSASSADDLVNWLQEHEYEFSPAVKDWAQPYVEQGWMITALKVAKDTEAPAQTKVDASALRMSFETERPLFPYREPASEVAAETLGARHRLLRIYFLSDGKYFGKISPIYRWTGDAVWAGELAAADRARILEHLGLAAETGPEKFWLTEFEDHWEYKLAPADLYFTKSQEQTPLRRPPTIIYDYAKTELPIDLTTSLFAIVLIAGAPVRRAWRNRRQPPA